MIRELGRGPSALAVAGEYLRFIDGFVVDREDAALVDGVRSLGIDVMASQTIMRADETRATFARGPAPRRRSRSAGALRQPAALRPGSPAR